VVSNVSVTSVPIDVAYDLGKGAVYVTEQNLSFPYYGNVSVISDSTDKVVTTVAVGWCTNGAAYDIGKGEVFVANAGSCAAHGVDNVDVINDTSNTVVATVTAGSSPYDVAYDSGKGEVFVANSGSGNVSVICDGSASCGGPPKLNTVVATVRVGSGPYGITYDAGKGEVFVANSGSDNVSVINDTSDAVAATVAVGSYPTDAAYDSGEGEVFVTNSFSPGSVSVICDGSASCGGSPKLNTVVATVPVGPTSSPWGVAFDNETGELFIANAATSTVNVISDLTNSVVANVSVGSGPQDVVYDSGKAEVFVTNEGSYTVSIIEVLCTVTFTETGLPTGTSWSVTLNGALESSTTTTIRFNVTDGKYGYTMGVVPGYAPAPPSGLVTASGAAVGVTVAFTQVTYTATFTESGLPGSTTWYVNITGGQSRSSTGNTISFTEPNGTYAYTVATMDKEYAPASASGSLDVSGTSISKSVAFNLVTYSVTFTETGLPSGTRWWVNLTNGQSFSSTLATLTFSEPNGTYSFSASAPGYQNETSRLTVNGANPTPVTVSFSQSSSSSSSLPLLDYEIIGVVVAVGVIGVVGVLLRRRGRAPPNPATPQSDAGSPTSKT